ncbi:hypothetical protein RFI_37436, partial [Reticulomyxa filosa]
DNPFLDNSLLKKIQQGIQEDEEKIQELKVSKEKPALTTNYRPSFYSGTFGVYGFHKNGAVKVIGEGGGIKMIEFMKTHTLKRPNYSQLTNSIPEIKSKPKEEQLELFASMYKNALFANQPKRPKLGGWTVLSIKNYKKTANAKVCSPEELGFSVIEPKYYGDPEYERSLVKKVRDGSIIIKSCTGNSGSFYVIIELENSSDEDITIEMQRGQVFEQNRFREVQNLAVKGFYKRGETSSPSQSIPEAPINVNKILLLEVPKKSSKIFELECFCIDNHYSCPEGEDMNVAPLICVAAQDNDDQGDVWNETNKNDIYD